MPIKATAILPNVNLKQSSQLVLDAVERGLDQAANEVLADFKATTATFSTPVEFTVEKEPFARTIKTSSKLYGWINNGTAGHFIEPVTAHALRYFTPFGAKTRPQTIQSNAGSRGENKVFATRVWNPGIEPREFAETIAARFQAGRLAELIQAEIKRARG